MEEKRQHGWEIRAGNYRDTAGALFTLRVRWAPCVAWLRCAQNESDKIAVSERLLSIAIVFTRGWGVLGEPRV